jgi:hypothetical protein
MPLKRQPLAGVTIVPMTGKDPVFHFNPRHMVLSWTALRQSPHQPAELAITRATASLARYGADTWEKDGSAVKFGSGLRSPRWLMVIGHGRIIADPISVTVQANLWPLIGWTLGLSMVAVLAHTHWSWSVILPIVMVSNALSIVRHLRRVAEDSSR